MKPVKAALNELYRGTYVWDGVGVSVEELSDLDDILVASGANFTVAKQSLDKVGIVSAEGEEITIEVPSKHVITRTDNNNALGIVGDNQTIIQNREAGMIGEALRNMSHGAWLNVGVLGRGEVVYMIQKLEDQYRIKGTEDIVEFYHVIINGHNGTTKFSMGFVPMQVRTRSVINIGDKNVMASAYEMKHTPGVGARVEAASQALAHSKAYFANWMLKADALAEESVTMDQVDSVISALFPAAEKRPGRSSNARKVFTDVYDAAYTDIPSLRETKWHLYSAVVEYADQYRTFKDSNGDGSGGKDRMQNRFETIIFRDTFKQKAYDRIKNL